MLVLLISSEGLNLVCHDADVDDDDDDDDDDNVTLLLQLHITEHPPPHRTPAAPKILPPRTVRIRSGVRVKLLCHRQWSR